MIVIFHKNDYVIRVEHIVKNKPKTLDQYTDTLVCESLFSIAELFTNETIVWCDIALENNVEFTKLESLLNSQMEMLSFNVSQENIFDKVLEYANYDATAINNIPNDVRFQTWIMSEAIGVVNARVINKFQSLKGEFSFQLTLNAISKLGSPYGLLHFSEPKLYAGKKFKTKQESLANTLKFIRVFQKRKWLLFIGLILLLKEPQKLLYLLIALMGGKKEYKVDSLEDLYNEVQLNVITSDDEIDVLIPTLGRKKYLKDVLDDLAQQTHLPKNVIIVEQHPDATVESELDYIYNQQWPFIIKHKFIHQLGACNARNIGIKLVESKWLFMADDDIRVEKETLQENIQLLKNLDLGATIISTYLPSQINEVRNKNICLFEGFASGASIVNKKYYSQLSYDMAYEFGYGEDSAYGNELRKLGCATLYSPKSAMLHLKAPVGGFRFKFKHPWIDDAIQPKPSPTVMYLHENYLSKEQLFAYKVFLFLGQALQKRKINIFKFKKDFSLQWAKSQYWAKQYRKDK